MSDMNLKLVEEQVKEMFELEYVRLLGNGKYAGIKKFMFTSAIITGKIGDFTGYDNRWCYHSITAAKKAMDNWNCEKDVEPSGWHRHPASGRRISESVDEIDDEGKKIGSIGVMFVRY